MKKILIKTKKLIVIAIIIGLNWGGLSAVGTTFAYYNDVEISNGNVKTAAQLDFVLDQSVWAPPGGELDLDPGESVSQDVTIVDFEDKSIEFKYIVRPQMSGGDDDFCDALEADVFLEGVPQYTGPLFDFVSATTTFATSTDTWNFDVSLPALAPDFNNKICEFDFIYSGWQIRFPGEGEGYHDVERVSNTIESHAQRDPFECPFEEGQGKTVIDFDDWIRSDKGVGDATAGPVSVSVPAGTYDVTLASYDEHSAKPGQFQPEEMWHLIFENSGGGHIRTTSAISDLPDADDQIIEKVETDFVLTQDASFVTAFHNAYPDSNPNSITPICALLEEKEPVPPPPDPSACPFEEGEGRTVISFNEVLGASGDEALATAGPVFGFVPAGTYDVTLASYDNHSDKPGQFQPEEMWHLVLDDINGDNVTTTSAISDLPDADDQIIEKVETDFVLAEDVFFATAFHSAYPDSNYNSIRPLCVAFDGPNAGGALAPPADLLGAPGGRAEEGLLALYTFEEEDETIVWDVSGVGEPLHLLIGDASATSRISGGLSVDSSTIISELANNTKIIDGIQATQEITIEAWITPENTTQNGPSRIVTYSKDTSRRNFTFGEGQYGSSPSDFFITRLRTTDTSQNGIPSLDTPSGTATTNLTHVVYTRDSSGNAKMYVGGVEVASMSVGGSVSNWEGSYKFALANEHTMDRTWLGDMHLVALYNKALSASEVEQNFKAGADRTVVLNEYLPNPLGSDNASKPDGEWVELYNLSDTAVDVDGWYLYDALDSHPLVISAGNSDNDGDTADAGETIVPASGYLIVYLDGAYSGWLNNSGGDTLRLYNGPIGTGVLVDSDSYSGNAPENKSYARIPDGVGAFVDPIPTPLAPNTIGAEEVAVTEEIIEAEEVNSGGGAPPVDEPVAEEEIIEIATTPSELTPKQSSVEDITGQTATSSLPQTGQATATTTEEMITEEFAEEVLPVEEDEPVEEGEVIVVPLELTDPQADPTSNGVQEEIEEIIEETLPEVGPDIVEEPAIIEPEVAPLELTDPQADPTSNGIQEDIEIIE